MNAPSSKTALLFAILFSTLLFAGWAKASQKTCSTVKVIHHLSDGKLAISIKTSCEVGAAREHGKQPARK